MTSATTQNAAGAGQATQDTPRDSMRDKVQGVINLIRPAVQADGGDIELVDVADDGVVQIRFHGACHGCPSSTMTLQMGIERNLREKVPEVTRVVPVQ
jgi:Fe-S cluster biogenesis protein NfuA